MNVLGILKQLFVIWMTRIRRISKVMRYRYIEEREWQQTEEQHKKIEDVYLKPVVHNGNRGTIYLGVLSLFIILISQLFNRRFFELL